MGQNDKQQPDTVAEVDPDVAQLLGLRSSDAEAMPEITELDGQGQITDTRIYEGELEARVPGSDQPDESAAENIEGYAVDGFRDGETDDPGEAAEEGLAWVPPTDPPTVPGDLGQPEIGAGFGTSALDEPYDPDHEGEALSPRDDVEARVLEALRADAATSALAAGLTIEAEGGAVTIDGEIDDVDDEDAIVAVAERVAGVAGAVSRLRLREPPAE
jgi:BON domain